MLKYEQSYTGQYAQYEPRIGKLSGELYVARELAVYGGKVRMARVSLGVKWYRATAGLHFGSAVSFYPAAGYEVWLNLYPCELHAGWLTGSTGKVWQVKYNGSSVKPYTRVSVRVGHMYVGCRVPEFMQRWLEQRAAAKWEKEFAAYEAAHPEMFVGEANRDEPF